MTFIANISSSGDYICVAKNNFGSIAKQITVNVNCKFILNGFYECLYIYCAVKYAYVYSGGGSLLNQVGLFYWKENISMVKKLKSYGAPLK